jgi:hypothetical protein
VLTCKSSKHASAADDFRSPIGSDEDGYYTDSKTPEADIVDDVHGALPSAEPEAFAARLREVLDGD